MFLRRKSAGFGLVEMLVSVGIVSTLATVTVPRMLGTIYSLPAKAAATAVESAVPFTGLSGVALGKKQVAIEDCELEHFVTRRGGRRRSRLCKRKQIQLLADWNADCE